MEATTNEANGTPNATALALEDVHGLLEEAREGLSRLAMIYATLDGDPSVNGGTMGPELRRDFNAEVANVFMAIDALSREIPKVAARALDAGLVGGRASS